MRASGWPALFQSSPGQKAGCNQGPYRRNGGWRRCFNPHPARRPGATWTIPAIAGPTTVSILTWPEGRVQQQRACAVQSAGIGFQSSPGQKAGCNTPVPTPTRGSCCFNPHPARRPGATTAGRRRGSPFPCFNPHPARRPGATARASDTRFRAPSFNPHPARRPGATSVQIYVPPETHKVSILTRPEGRVQLPVWTPSTTGIAVSILTRPEGRVQPLRQVAACVLERVSILTRPEGRVQRWCFRR